MAEEQIGLGPAVPAAPFAWVVVVSASDRAMVPSGPAVNVPLRRPACASVQDPNDAGSCNVKLPDPFAIDVKK